MEGYREVIMNKKKSYTSLLVYVLLTINVVACATSQGNVSNGQIVFQSSRDGNFDLYIMNPDGTDQRNLTNSPPSITSTNNNFKPAPSPDGRQIAFQTDRDGNLEIYVVDIQSGVQLNLTSHSAKDYSPTWSPDGKLIAFISDREATLVNAERDIWTNNIYIMNSDGSNVRRLTIDNETDGYGGLSWSPDGKKIAFTLSASTPYGGFFSRGINTITLSDFQLSLNVPDANSVICCPNWSPDGKHIVYSALGDNSENIYTIDVENNVQRALTSNTQSYDTTPFWSPDGKYIVFSSNRDGHYHIYIMNADGSNQLQLTDGPDDGTFPVWLPTQ
jgi:Tol biopolymer transport system component